MKIFTRDEKCRKRSFNYLANQHMRSHRRHIPLSFSVDLYVQEQATILCSADLTLRRTSAPSSTTSSSSSTLSHRAPSRRLHSINNLFAGNLQFVSFQMILSTAKHNVGQCRHRYGGGGTERRTTTPVCLLCACCSGPHSAESLSVNYIF